MKKISLSIVSIVLFGLFFFVPIQFNFASAPIHSLFLGPNIGMEIAQGFANEEPGFFATALSGALLLFFKFIFYELTSVITVFSGWFLDFFLKHTISSSSYRTGIIESGWEIVRDLVNIGFIFSLMIIAFQKVFNAGKSDTNKRLMKTIVIALVMNFSLYAVYLFVDASNILANLFYNRITVEGTATVGSGMGWLAGLFAGDTKSISTALMSQFNPQRIILDAGAQAGNMEFILYGAAGILNILIFLLFFSVALVFLSRTVVIMILGVLAPLALMSLVLPGLEGNKYIGFNNWLKQLIGISFTAPVFLFFLFIIIKFASNDGFISTIFTGNANLQNPSVLSTIMAVLLPFAFLGVLLLMAKKVTADLAGELGGMVSGAITKVAAGGAAVGAIALTGGVAAAGMASRGVGVGLKAGFGDNKISRGASSIGKLAQTAKFDLNKIPGFKNQLGGLGALGGVLGKGMNTSYADADTAVRAGANNFRAGWSNFKTGKTPESVAKWQENVNANRVDLLNKRTENAARQAQDTLVISEKNKIKSLNSDGKVIETGYVGKNAKDLLREKKAERNRMTEQKRKDEEKAIKEKTGDIRNQMEVEEKLLKEAKSPLERKGLKASIKRLKENIENIESTTVEGTIKQLEKSLEDVGKTAKAEVLKDDKAGRSFAQDSSATFGYDRGKNREEQRQRRVDDVTSRLGESSSGSSKNSDKKK